MANLIPDYEYDTCLPAGRSSSATARKTTKLEGEKRRMGEGEIKKKSLP